MDASKSLIILTDVIILTLPYIWNGQLLCRPVLKPVDVIIVSCQNTIVNEISQKEF